MYKHCLIIIYLYNFIQTRIRLHIYMVGKYRISSYSSKIKTVIPGTGLLHLFCRAGNFGKIWSACGQYEIQYIE